MVSLNVSLNLEIVDPTNKDGLIVEVYYGGSSSHKEEVMIVEVSGLYSYLSGEA